MYPYLYLIVSICWLFSAQANQQISPQKPVKKSNIISLTIQPDVYNDYIRFLAGRDPLHITNFSQPFARRDIADAILFQQALAIGESGIKYEIEFILGNYYGRNLQLLKTGQLLSTLDSIWDLDLTPIKAEVYITDALIDQGEYEAGFYIADSNKKAKKARSLTDIQALTAVVNENWRVDLLTLQQIAPKHIFFENNWSAIVKELNHHLADFVLAPFQQTDDLSLRVSNQVDLIPIPNIKIKLAGSRHFAVSKHHNLADKVFPALDKGIKQLKTSGRIKEIYSQVGFHNKKVKNWIVINPK